MREPPCELPRTWPCSNRSRSATDRPRRTRCQAVAEPMAPAPTTTTSTRRTAGGLPALDERGLTRHVAVLEQGVDRTGAVVQVAVEEVQDAGHDRVALHAAEGHVGAVDQAQQVLRPVGVAEGDEAPGE